MRKRNVGMAPGTTTIHIGPTGDFGAIPTAMQYSIESGANPAFTPAGSPLRIEPQWAGLGAPIPNDFERARIYGYLPVTSGWIPGRLTTLSDGEPGTVPSGTKRSMWSTLGAVEKGAVIAGGAVTAIGAVLAFMDRRRYAKILLGLGATGGTILLGYALGHMGRAREMIAAPNLDPATAPAVFDAESKAEAFDLIAGGVLLSGVITGLMMLGPGAD